MESRDIVIASGYLPTASSEAVFQWLKNSFFPYDPEYHWSFSELPAELFKALLDRNDKTIDLGLAAWCNNHFVAKSIFHRYCSPKMLGADWPPKSYTFPYAVLSALLSGPCAKHVLWDTGDTSFASDKTDTLQGMGEKAFDELLLYLASEKNDGSYRLNHLIHMNPWIGPELLDLLANQKGAYGQMEYLHWMFILRDDLLANPAINRKARDYHDSPDMAHWGFHKNLVKVIAMVPKTELGAVFLAGLLTWNLKSSSTKEAYLGSDLNTALTAWVVEISEESDDSNKQNSRLPGLADEDSLSASERVRFHLLRHYAHVKSEWQDSSEKVERLAYYAKRLSMNDKKLPVQKFADRDGPAFVYATAFNEGIWKNKNAVEAFNRIKVANPESMRSVNSIRDEISPGWMDNDDEPLDGPELDRLDALPMLVRAVHKELATQITLLSKVVIWSAVSLGAILIFWR